MVSNFLSILTVDFPNYASARVISLLNFFVICTEHTCPRGTHDTYEVAISP